MDWILQFSASTMLKDIWSKKKISELLIIRERAYQVTRKVLMVFFIMPPYITWFLVGEVREPPIYLPQVHLNSVFHNASICNVVHCEVREPPVYTLQVHSQSSLTPSLPTPSLPRCTTSFPRTAFCWGRSIVFFTPTYSLFFSNVCLTDFVHNMYVCKQLFVMSYAAIVESEKIYSFSLQQLWTLG